MNIAPDETRLSLSQYMVLARMELAEGERLAGWGVELVDKFPLVTTLRERVYLGSFAWTLTKSRKKLMMIAHARQLGARHVTPAEIARAYLRLKYSKRTKRMTGMQASEFVDYRSQPPLYCTPCSITDALYIDIKSAYWSIVQTVGWDVEYMPERWLGVGDTVSDFPFADDKLARNCLVSCGLPSNMSVWTGTKLTIQKGWNDFINLMLWGLVCDVLNGVARDVVQAGAVYCYTDGYIVPANRANDVFDVLESWGLPFGVKHSGRCVVQAPASYSFPDYQTRQFGVSRVIHYDKIADRGGKWLRPKFRQFAEMRIVQCVAQEQNRDTIEVGLE